MVLNGPNTNLYGTLDPATYGSETFESIRERCVARGGRLGFSIDFRQSNHEGALVDWIQEARETSAAIVMNGAGYAYTSVALLDALSTFEGPVIEVHLSNTARREPFRHRSYIALAATGTIAGMGPFGYELALEAVADILARDA
jgi:3-dehydroquinate dehydratase-2